MKVKWRFFICFLLLLLVNFGVQRIALTVSIVFRLFFSPSFFFASRLFSVFQLHYKLISFKNDEWNQLQTFNSFGSCFFWNQTDLICVCLWLYMDAHFCWMLFCWNGMLQNIIIQPYRSELDVISTLNLLTAEWIQFSMGCWMLLNAKCLFVRLFNMCTFICVCISIKCVNIIHEAYCAVQIGGLLMLISWHELIANTQQGLLRVNEYVLECVYIIYMV